MSFILAQATSEVILFLETDSRSPSRSPREISVLTVSRGALDSVALRASRLATMRPSSPTVVLAALERILRQQPDLEVVYTRLHMEPHPP